MDKILSHLSATGLFLFISSELSLFIMPSSFHLSKHFSPFSSIMILVLSLYRFFPGSSSSAFPLFFSLHPVLPPTHYSSSPLLWTKFRSQRNHGGFMSICTIHGLK